MTDKKFEYMTDGDGYEIECSCCSSYAPVINRINQYTKEEIYSCEICYKSLIGIKYDCNPNRSNMDVYQAIAQVANILLDKITDRANKENEVTE